LAFQNKTGGLVICTALDIGPSLAYFYLVYRLRGGSEPSKVVHTKGQLLGAFLKKLGGKML